MARVDPQLRRILQPRREAPFLYDAVMLYAHSLAKVRDNTASEAA